MLFHTHMGLQSIVLQAVLPAEFICPKKAALKLLCAFCHILMGREGQLKEQEGNKVCNLASFLLFCMDYRILVSA